MGSELSFIYKASVESSVRTWFYERFWISNQCSQRWCKNIVVSDRDFFCQCTGVHVTVVLMTKMKMSLKNLRIKSPSVNCPLTGSWPFMENVHCSSFSWNLFNEFDCVLSEIRFWWIPRHLTCSAPLSVSLSRLLQCIGQLAFCGQSHQLARLQSLYLLKPPYSPLRLSGRCFE